MIRVPCSKCGSVDFPKYRRMKLRKTGDRTPSMASYCVRCHAEAQKEREARRYEAKLEYNREWKKVNRDKANASERRYYEKNKDEINEKRRLEYIPKPPSPKTSRPKSTNTGWHKHTFMFGKLTKEKHHEKT